MMAKPPESWAVLIGIDFYVPVKQRLTGAVNDVEDMSVFIQQSYNPVNIAKYVAVDSGDPNQKAPQGPKESWPTYLNITSQLQHIVQVSSPGDHVFFHYSGHGTLRSTKKKQYQIDTGSDAALVLFDETSSESVRYLHGIELASFFNQMVSKQLKLTVILDCCHSGGVSRGKHSFRGVPWSHQVGSAYSISVSQLSNQIGPPEDSIRDGKASGFWLLSPRGYSVIAACGPDELAWECIGSDGKSHGTLSTQLFGALTSISSSGRAINMEYVYRKICAKMHVSVPDQHPLLLGGSSVSFMGNINLSKNSLAMCDVINVYNDGYVLLNIGHAHGVCQGDQFTVYPDEVARDAASSIRSGLQVSITIVAELESKGLLVDQTNAKSSKGKTLKVKKGWYGALSRPSRSKAHVQLFAGAGEEWQRRIGDSLWLQVKDIEEISATFPSFSIKITDQNEYAILTNGCSRILALPSIPVGTSNAPAKIVSAVEHMAKFANIESLENRIQSSVLEPEAFSIEFKDEANPQTVIDGNTLQVRDGSDVEIVFQNKSKQTLYLTVLDLMPLGEISRLYPGDRDYFTLPPVDAEFSGSTSFGVGMTIPDSLKRQGQLQSDDVMKFFITTQSSSFNMLQLPPLLDTVYGPDRGSFQSLWNFIDSIETNDFSYGESRTDGSSGGNRWTCQNFTIRTIISS